MLTKILQKVKEQEATKPFTFRSFVEYLEAEHGLTPAESSETLLHLLEQKLVTENDDYSLSVTDKASCV